MPLRAKQKPPDFQGVFEKTCYSLGFKTLEFTRFLRVLPRRLGDTWQLALVSHVAEANTRYTELSQNTTWAAIDCIAVANTNWRCVAWKLL
jgi:hypothetical protein